MGDAARRDGALRAIAGPDMVVLRTPVQLRGEDMTTVGEFTVDAGETRAVRADLRAVAPAAAGADRRRRGARTTTETFWRDWAGASADRRPVDARRSRAR